MSDVWLQMRVEDIQRSQGYAGHVSVGGEVSRVEREARDGESEGEFHILSSALHLPFLPPFPCVLPLFFSACLREAERNQQSPD